MDALSSVCCPRETERLTLAAISVPAPAGYAVEYTSHAGVICLGYGITHEAAWSSFRQQVLGASPSWRTAFASRATLRPLTADEASEVAEMLDAPWLDVGSATCR